LAAGEISTGKTSVTVPKITPKGTFYLLFCADDLGVVDELKEANNCRASTTTIVVYP
jgi:hypothetical protein